MARLLLMEGNTASRRAKGEAVGLPSSSAVYAQAINAHYPRIEIDVINAADPDASIPHARGFADYNGLVITGSSLHAYRDEFPVTNQIAILKAAAETGIPMLGSCWGLQIAVVAAGGKVGLSPKGREVGFARKIQPTAAGAGHVFLQDKGAVFDAPCIHYDEVTQLPHGAILLASNAHSAVQAAIIPLGKSEVWAVQYHPEFGLAQLARLYTLYADDMLVQGFFKTHAELNDYTAKLTALAQNPHDAALAWQIGIDQDITDDQRRNAEIIAWIEHCVIA